MAWNSISMLQKCEILTQLDEIGTNGGIYLEGGDEQGIDQIEVTVDGFRMHGVMFLLLTGFADDLNGFDSVILLVAPIDQPHLVQMLHVEDIHRVSIRHYYLNNNHYNIITTHNEAINTL